jgi:hypothetical protein
MSLIYINPYLFSAAATDPDFASVSLLLHMDGTNGSTTFTDSSSSNRTITAFGNAQISTAQNKFGGASALFDGNGDYLTAPSDASFAFGTGNFTVEGWVYFGNLSTFSTIVSTRGQGNSLTGWTIGLDSSERPYFYTNGFDILGSALAQNTWHYFAVAKDGSNLQMYIDGAQVGSTFTDTKNYTLQDLAIGSVTGGLQVWNGYIDDLRITKGVARYTANFTAPTAPFPDA